MSYTDSDSMNDWLWFLVLITFYFTDLLTTGIGLEQGFVETSPFAYLFGNAWYVVLMWLAVQKILFLMLLGHVISKAKTGYRESLLNFTYGVLFAYGLAVTLQNLR